MALILTPPRTEKPHGLKLVTTLKFSLFSISKQGEGNTEVKEPWEIEIPVPEQVPHPETENHGLALTMP